MSNLEDIREKKFPIRVGNETKFLHYDLNATGELVNIYGSVGKAIDAFCARIEQGEVNINTVINFAWAGLIHANENLTKKEVSKMFQYKDLQSLASSIDEAFAHSFPVPEGEPKKEQSQAENLNAGIGSGSTTQEQ